MRLAVIPARGGSKRIPRKNLREFCGRPMLAWSIAAARDSGCFDRILVSTDDAEIAAVARELGAETPFLRPDALSDDHTPTIPVVAHATRQAAALWGPADLVCCLYATAPFVRADDLRRGLERLRAGNCDYVFAVTTFPFPIQRALRRAEDGRVALFHPEHQSTRSQDLEEAWHDAGQFYWGRAEAWLQGLPIMGPGSVGLPLPRHRVQDIDTPEDWTRAEFLFRALAAEPDRSDSQPCLHPPTNCQNVEPSPMMDHTDPEEDSSVTLRKNSLIWIDPRECTHFVTIGGGRMSGVVLDGDWDLRAKPITEMFKVKACLQHWREGVPWEETGIFEFMESLLARRATKQVDGCKSRSDIEARYARIDKLYDSIKSDGAMKTSYQLGIVGDPLMQTGGVVIHFDREGKPLFSGSGHHRFSIAIALNLPEMPAMLGAVHPQALDKIQERLRHAKQRLNEKDGTTMGYQSTRSTESKFELIKSNIDTNRLHNLLDIGCNEGLLTTMFSKLGIFCVGLDISPHFVDRFKESGTPAFGVLPMTQERAERIPQFDAILLLSVHHQWVKSQGDEAARKLVATIASKANKYFVIEFAAIAKKYGYAKAPFKDNDEASLAEYALGWLRGLGVPGNIRQIGKNPELAGKEPFRYSFVIERG